jgi:hypothetical protein
METLDTFEMSKGYDAGLDQIIAMWKKEKEKAYRAYGVSPTVPSPSRLKPRRLYADLLDRECLQWQAPPGR